MNAFRYISRFQNGIPSTWIPRTVLIKGPGIPECVGEALEVYESAVRLRHWNSSCCEMRKRSWEKRAENFQQLATRILRFSFSPQIRLVKESGITEKKNNNLHEIFINMINAYVIFTVVFLRPNRKNKNRVL